MRNLLETCTAVREVAIHPAVRRLVDAILGPTSFATRAIFFDKTPDANWALGWHQDSVIAVRERRDAPGFLAWGDEAGVLQVQPPPEILAHMLAIRLHLDDCGPENGALRVLPGSHRHGWLDDAIDDWRQRVPEVTCAAAAGDVVAMCPTILHASSRATTPKHRRVIHIEYANEDLPHGLEWNQRVTP